MNDKEGYMGDFGYIFGYGLFVVFAIGGIVGHIAGYRTRKYEEPKYMQDIVDDLKTRSRLS